MILTVVLIAVLIILKQAFAITSVTVKAPSRTGDIQTEAQKLLQGDWQQGSLLTFDDGDFTDKLLATDPMLKTADVRRSWPHGLTVTATLKQPSLGWSTGNQNYLLDLDGTAIGALPAGSTIPMVVDGSNLPVKLGQKVATARFVAFVMSLPDALKQSGLAATRYEVKDTTLDLYVTTNKGYYLLLDTGREPAGAAADLKSITTYLQVQKKAPATYIDLRVAGKAYYK
jgi:cell division septal protein FtsQ